MLDWCVKEQTICYITLPLLSLVFVHRDLLISQMPPKTHNEHVLRSASLKLSHIRSFRGRQRQRLGERGWRKDSKSPSHCDPPAQLWFITSSVTENGWAERAAQRKCTGLSTPPPSGFVLFSWPFPYVFWNRANSVSCCVLTVCVWVRFSMLELKRALYSSHIQFKVFHFFFFRFGAFPPQTRALYTFTYAPAPSFCFLKNVTVIGNF